MSAQLGINHLFTQCACLDMVETTNVEVNELEGVAQTKNEAHTFIKVCGRKAIPKKDHVNIQYLADVFCGEQEWVFHEISSNVS